jgi:hypothetical protein
MKLQPPLAKLSENPVHALQEEEEGISIWIFGAILIAIIVLYWIFKNKN